MKTFLILLSVLAAHVDASEIQCLTSDVSLSLVDLQDSSDTSDASYEKLLSCEDDLFSGEICYKGSQSDALKILTLVDKNLFEPAGEYYMQNIQAVDDTNITYSIIDGPNESVTSENLIGACK